MAGTIDVSNFLKIAGSTGGGAVSTVFGRVGDVIAVSGDYSVAQVSGAAPAANPTLTGTVTVPTTATGDNSTAAASTALVTAKVAAIGSIPGPSVTTPLVDGTGAIGTAGTYAKADHVHPTDTSRAAVTSAVLTTPTLASTPAANDNSLKVADTAYVDRAAANSGVVTAANEVGFISYTGSAWPVRTTAIPGGGGMVWWLGGSGTAQPPIGGTGAVTPDRWIADSA